MSRASKPAGGAGKRKAAPIAAAAAVGGEAKAEPSARAPTALPAAASRAVVSKLPFASRKPREGDAAPRAAAKLAPATPPDLAPAGAEVQPCAPLRLPKTAAAAAKACGRLGIEYKVCDAVPAEYGRALYAGDAGFAAGAIIAAYDGERHTTRTRPAGAPKTHMLRVIGSDEVVDGRPLADGLQRGRDGTWWPANELDVRRGYAALANSAPEREANAKMEFISDYGDDRVGVRPNSALAALLPKRPFLVAKRDIAAGEEVLWSYQVAL